MDTQKPQTSSNSWKSIVGIMVIVFVGYFAFSSFQHPQGKVLIAISQIVEHDALDEERAGILKALSDAGYIEGENLKIVYENAQGNIATSAQIASKLVSLKPTVIVAISTPSAQSLVSICEKHNIPLVFTAVTNPEEARLITPHKSANVTGVSDYISPEKHFSLIKAIVSNPARVGIIYNAGEANSVSLMQDIEKEAEKQGIKLVIATAAKTGDVATAAERLVGERVDAIYIPNDNTAVSAMESIVSVAIKGYVADDGERRSVPVIAGDSGSVNKGALATMGYRRETLGYKAGLQVLQIIKGAKASDLPVERGDGAVNMFNMDTAEKMNITISPALLMEAIIVKRAAS